MGAGGSGSMVTRQVPEDSVGKGTCSSSEKIRVPSGEMKCVGGCQAFII